MADQEASVAAAAAVDVDVVVGVVTWLSWRKLDYERARPLVGQQVGAQGVAAR